MKSKRIDQPLLLSLFFLLGIGIVQVYSASYIYAIETLNDGLYFFKKQVLFSGLAILTFFITWKIPWTFYKKGALALWLIVMALLIMTLYSPFGVEVNGASRWLVVGGFRFQPAEALKVLTPLLWATLFLQYQKKRENRWFYLSKVLIFVLPFVFLLMQPDFGTFVICTLMVFGILFSFGLKWRYVFGFSVSACLLFTSLIWFSPYRKARLLSFLDPWSDMHGSGFQVIQSMMSFYSGGLTGVGLGQGQGKLFFLPEAHTDFTLAVLAEETGFIGVLIIIALFTFIIFRSMRIAIQAKDKIKKCVATGLVIGFAFQVFTNIGVTMGVLPTKGITLPFLSYGGSSLIGTAFLFGLLFNIRTSEKAKRT